MITFHQAPARPVYRKTRAAEMADAMREMAFAGRTVDEAALANAGFTLAEVAELAPLARDLANRQSIRRVEAHA